MISGSMEWTVDGETEVLGPGDLVYIPLADEAPGLTLGVAMLASLKKTVVIEIFLQYCRQQINENEIPGMASL